VPQARAGISARQRYRLIASALYIFCGVVIIAKAVVAVVIPLVLLGCVFVALGTVNVRNYLSWRRTAGGR
jgi:uncharacterized membrane protein HdeD (DUF308 family)